MTRSSGFFLSILLVLFCMWLNLWRYPAVRVMLGENLPVIEQKEESEPLTVQSGIPLPDDVEVLSTDSAEDYSSSSRNPQPVFVVPVSRSTPHEDTRVIYPAAGSPGTMVMSCDYPTYVDIPQEETAQ